MIKPTIIDTGAGQRFLVTVDRRGARVGVGATVSIYCVGVGAFVASDAFHRTGVGAETTLAVAGSTTGAVTGTSVYSVRVHDRQVGTGSVNSSLSARGTKRRNLQGLAADTGYVQVGTNKSNGVRQLPLWLCTVVRTKGYDATAAKSTSHSQKRKSVTALLGRHQCTQQPD